MGNGSRKPIADIVVGETVITHKGRAQAVLAVHEQGCLPCVEVTTQRGRKTIAALSHPFLTTHGWVEAGDLVPGDTLAVVPEPATNAEPASLDLARMAGYFVGDGATGPVNNGSSCNAKITCADADTAADILETATRCGWGHNVRQKHPDQPALDYAFTGGVREWLKDVGLAFKGSRTKRVPEFVMRGGPEVAAEFLAAYFLCDGTVNARSGKRDDCCVEWCSVNLDLMRDTQHLLLRLGVQATLRTRVGHTKWSPPEGTVSHRLSVSTVDDCAKLLRRLRLVGPKARRLQEWSPKRNTFSTPDLLPDAVVFVERVGALPCRCLTVEDDHTFTSDDLVVHNSETATIRGAAWSFERHPDQNVLLTAATQRLANRFSKKSRAIVAARRSLSPDSKAADEWTLPEGGSFVARGVGNPPVGIGFRRIYIDDPIRRREDAESEVYREKAWDWYTDDLYNRLEPGGAIVLVCTRWHELDVAARAIDSEPGRWTILNLSAIAEEPMPEWDWRQVGETLWPDRYDAEALERIRSVMVANEGEYAWRALFQQQPTAKVGGFFDQTKVQVGTPGTIVRSARAWDLAATKDGGDWTAGVKIGADTDGRFWILDIKRERYDTDQRDRLIVQTAAVDGVRDRVRLPQDPGQAGKSEGIRLLRMLAGHNVRILPVSGPKTTRAMGLAAQVNGGNVSIAADCPHRAALLEEMRSFPSGRTDDMIDAAADAFTEVMARRVITAGAA